jgi:spermidine synthase
MGLLRWAAVTAVALWALAPARAAEPAAEARVIHREPSPYGTVLVVDEGRRRYLRFDSAAGDDQSMIDLDDPRAVPMDYIRLSLIGLAIPAEPRRVLMVGLGGGTFSTLLRQVAPDLRIDVAEINPVVVSVAKTFFRVTEDEHLKITLADGKRFLVESAGGYDLVYLDAYTGNGIPAHLRTAGFFALAHNRLRPGGVVMANISADRGTERTLVGAMKVSMPSLACLRTADTLNLVVIASTADLPRAPALVSRVEALAQRLALPFVLGPLASAVDLGCVRALALDEP